MRFGLKKKRGTRFVESNRGFVCSIACGVVSSVGHQTAITSNRQAMADEFFLRFNIAATGTADPSPVCSRHAIAGGRSPRCSVSPRTKNHESTAHVHRDQDQFPGLGRDSPFRRSLVILCGAKFQIAGRLARPVLPTFAFRSERAVSPIGISLLNGVERDLSLLPKSAVRATSPRR